MKAWQYCLECEHEYPSARSIRKAYRRGYWQATGIKTGWPRTSWLRRLWHVLTIRAKRIYFCQECAHDFLFPPKSWTSDALRAEES